MESVSVDDEQGNEDDLLAHDIGGIEPCGDIHVEFPQQVGQGVPPVLHGIEAEHGVFGGEIAQRFRGDLLQNCRVDPLRQAAILFFNAIIAPVRVR